MPKGFLLLLYCLFSCLYVAAQMPRKAERKYTAGMLLKSKKRTEKACKAMELAIKKSPSSPEPYSQLGQWYFEAHRFTEAAQLFRQASSRCHNGGSRFAKPLARSLVYAGQASNALQVINTFATIKDSVEWNKMRFQAIFIKEAMTAPSPNTPTNIGPRVNSNDPEVFPSMAVDSQTLYYTRRVHNMDEDFFSARYDSCGGWLYGRNMGEPPNTVSQESSQFISADGHYLFFTRCENQSEDAWTEGGCDLFMTYRIGNDSEWTQPQAFGATINTPAYEGMPSLSPDNRELYFVSDREGGYGGYDIYISRFEDGLWQMPINAGPTINTSGNETAPYMNVDNQTLYFTSNGWPGMGGTDIFMSHKLSDSSYTKAANLGYPINSACDEMSECVTLDGSRLYFASDRSGPAGNYDLYEVPLPATMKPIPVSYIYGVVYDSISKLRLNYAMIYICNGKTGDTIYKFPSNRGDASYLITLHLNNSYAISAWHSGYQGVSDTITFDKQYIQDPLVHNIAMITSGYVAPVPEKIYTDSLLATLHFDVNRVELSDSDKTAIHNVLNSYLNRNEYTILVNAYTDNTGTPMINEQLSYQRARQVSKQIITLGVPLNKLVAKGWGEAKMIATNDTQEGQRMNRRVEIIIRKAED
jgi:outer membrane protein OmpA-like peptidoglycan-associated protein